MRSHLLILSLTTALGLGSTGCIKKILVDGQIQAFRQAASAVDTVGDFDVGRAAAESGLAQFEGMHALDPDNVDALYLLSKTWTAYGSAFAEDDMQIAQDAGNDDLAEYHRKRARMAYDRAIFFGLQVLGQRDNGFEKAKGNELSLDKWLKDNFKDKDDAVYLTWVGAAWVARVGLMQGDDNEGPGFIAELYVGVSLLKRAIALDPSAEHYQADLVLAAYHARSGMAELGEAKQILDDVNAKTGGKLLFVPLYYAQRYACAKGDAAIYQENLNRILAADNPSPEQRLENAIAKRQARRWLGKRRAKDVCGIDLGGGASTPEPAPAPAPASAPPPEPAPPAEAAPEKPEKPAKPEKPKKAPHKPTAMAKPAATSH